MKNGRVSQSITAKLGFALLLLLLLVQTRGQAASCSGNPPIPDNCGDLPYTKGFLVTGNYVVGGVDLTENINPIFYVDGHGFSTGEIVMSGVPDNADIVAAYLFWETLTLETNPTDVNGVKFRGTPLDMDDAVIVKRTQFPLRNAPNSTCWGQGPALT